MINKTISFRSEAELVRCYDSIIQDAIDSLSLDANIQYEVPAPGGVPDLVIFTEQKHALQYVITFEFKLSNWQRAIRQAFRYRNFGNEAYVILDQSKAKAAIQNVETFRKANIGLITVDTKYSLRTWFLPEPKLPFSTEFSQRVATTLLSPRYPRLNELPFIKTIQGNTTLSQLKAIWSCSL